MVYIVDGVLRRGVYGGALSVSSTMWVEMSACVTDAFGWKRRTSLQVADILSVRGTRGDMKTPVLNVENVPPVTAWPRHPPY